MSTVRVPASKAGRDLGSIRVRRSPNPAAVSGVLYGLFLEDINFAADGGLNANLVNNYTFDGAYLDRSNGYSQLGAVMLKKKASPLSDPLRHWSATGRLESRADGGATAGARYARLLVEGTAELVNHGYPGDGPSMGCRGGVDVHFSALLRADAWQGEVEISLIDASGQAVATVPIETPASGWGAVRATLDVAETGLYSLRIRATGSGAIDIDEVSLVADDHWGAGDPRWSQGLLRRDLVESLAALQPTFLRFPGGCIVEGVGQGNQYDWRDTVGPLVDRSSKFSLWAEGRDDGDYSQSNQLGFYEYFSLCEDLGLEPVPVVWAGLSCQYRSDECTPTSSVEFQDVLRSAVDLIEWATGDPATNRWAALRAEAGHPEPFDLNYVGIGNENHGEEYLVRFDAIKAAIDARRPGLRVILASGAFPKGKAFELSHAHAADRSDLIVDEHSYASPKWFIEQSPRYDSYPRRQSRVMVGEYAAYPIMSPVAMIGRYAPNRWQSAVAEAAFLTGVERNADVVEMTCYAPLFAHIQAKQWRHNLIEFTPHVVQPTVNYEVQQLFGEAVGREMRDVRVERAPGVFASATGGERDHIVKVVNTSSSARRVRLDLDGGAGGHASVVQLSAPAQSRATFQGLTPSGSPVNRREWREGLHDESMWIDLPPHSVTRVHATFG